jgi:molybdopterin/thiamine biosynthesis adenylyltransferase
MAAVRLGDLAPDSHRFVGKRVLLTGERAVLATANGRYCLLGSLRLLVRVCPNLAVFLPAGSDELVAACRALVRRLAFDGDVEFLAEMPDDAAYDAVLSVGTNPNPALPCTVINSNGWLARVSSGTTPLDGTCDVSNPVGALGAACLGVGDVFKRLIRLKESRGRLLDGVTFSLFNYRCGINDPGPPLPPALPLDMLLVGAGAIGNGVIYLLSLLPVSGQVSIVDAQTFGDENLGTCILIGPGDLGVPKALFAERILTGSVAATGFHEDLDTFARRLGQGMAYPRVVVTALDNIDTRHQAQSLWPDVIIDGAIGDFPCQVSQHRHGEDSACMVCLFRRPPGPSAETVASRATGLSPSRTQQADAVVTDADVHAALPECQDWLRERVGRPICSVVREGVARQISEEVQRAGFAPSVPFVACLSACMVVAELIKEAARWPTELVTRFQFDVLRGPAFGLMVPQDKRRDCTCFVRTRNIQVIRQRRQ